MNDAAPRGDDDGDDTPRWVKAFLLVLVLLLVVVLAAFLAGGHGPGIHWP
jgi:hypothetical protein